MANNSTKGARIKRSLAQSGDITAAWNWFMILAGKAAEPVLTASVLSASVKLLPIVHSPAQFDVVVFIAQFVALDIGGLSLNKLAGQAKKEAVLQKRKLICENGHSSNPKRTLLLLKQHPFTWRHFEAALLL